MEPLELYANFSINNQGGGVYGPLREVVNPSKELDGVARFGNLADVPRTMKCESLAMARPLKTQVCCGGGRPRARHSKATVWPSCTRWSIGVYRFRHEKHVLNRLVDRLMHKLETKDNSAHPIEDRTRRPEEGSRP